MMEEKKSETEKLMKQKKQIEVVAAMAILLAVIIVLVGVFIMVPAGMMDSKHMDQPKISYQDWKANNETYTWSAHELMSRANDGLWVMAIGAIVFAFGYAALIFNVGDKQIHRLNCKQPTDEYDKYCPECGIKLSRLEKV